MNRLRSALPWMVGCWLIGVAVLSLRFWVGWRVVQGIRRSGSVPDQAWEARFDRLRGQLRISRPVSLLISATTAVPMVIGWLKPVVLVPAGLFVGLTTAQVEAILAHELAHVRRNDYLVNLLQIGMEMLFFYHPGVWWISAQMRQEREHCCDEMAASLASGPEGPMAYARALTALEEMCQGVRPAAVMVSANSGSLLERVRRVMGLNPQRNGLAAPWLCGMMLACAAGALALSLVEVRGEAPAPVEETPPHRFLDTTLAKNFRPPDTTPRDQRIGVEDDYLRAYLIAQTGERLFEDGKTMSALYKLREAKSIFEMIRQNYPGWQPDMTKGRLEFVDRTISTVEKAVEETKRAMQPKNTATLTNERPSFDWEVISHGGQDYVTLSSFARFYQCEAPLVNNLRFSVRTRKVLMQNQMLITGEVGKATIQINGINMALNGPAVQVDRKVLLLRKDVSWLFDPVLRPSRVKVPAFNGTVVLDAGHGGNDNGRVSPNGKEKDAALALTKALQPKLEATGFKVILTRNGDEFVESTERLKIANSHPGAVLVSLHFNSAWRGAASKVEGLETYFQGGEDKARLLNKAALPLSEEQQQLRNASLQLATAVHGHILNSLGLQDRAIRPANFRILSGSEIPAILVEGGYMSHPEESKRIVDPIFQDKMADSIVKGLKAYQAAISKSAK